VALRRLSWCAWLALAVSVSGCGRGVSRQYEYEEDLYLRLDGSATVLVNASVPALVALRGLDLDPAPNARLDRAVIRAAYASAVTEVVRISRPWRRAGRRFVQIRLAVADVRRLGDVPPFAWSAYRLEPAGDFLIYRQTLGKAAGRDPGDPGWTGREVVAVRLHLPSRIEYHNARDLETGEAAGVERGNILVWEQRLADRLAGTPVAIDARVEARSILRTTLWIFGVSAAAAVGVMAGLIWWAVRRGRRASRATGS